MTELYDSTWLCEQLARSLTMLEGAWAALPEERWAVLPPERLTRISSWPAQLHLYHLYQYERITLATSGLLAGGWRRTHSRKRKRPSWCALTESKNSDGSSSAVRKRWRGCANSGRLCWRNWRAHADWDAIHDTLVGDHNLHWVMAKCFQHTLEHTTTLLQLALFWDRTGYRGD